MLAQSQWLESHSTESNNRFIDAFQGIEVASDPENHDVHLKRIGAEPTQESPILADRMRPDHACDQLMAVRPKYRPDHGPFPIRSSRLAPIQCAHHLAFKKRQISVGSGIRECEPHAKTQRQYNQQQLPDLH